MTGTILIEGLKIECIVGILDHERTTPQVILVDAELDRDFAPAVTSESVDDTVDYVDVAGLLTRLAVEGRYQLLETFVAEATERMLEEFGGTRSMVKVMKPSAVEDAQWAAVKLERHR